MKRLLLILIVLSVPINLFASPFLTSDCTPAVDAVTGFAIQFGTATPIDLPAVNTCGGAVPVNCTGDAKTLCYDLASLPNGAFSVKALAKNAWGSSAYSVPLADTKAVPSSPSSLRIIK